MDREENAQEGVSAPPRKPLPRGARLAARAIRVRGQPVKPSAIQARRQYLELSLGALADRTSIHWAVLTDFEKSLPASTHLDSLIEAALFIPPGALRAGLVNCAAPMRICEEISNLLAKLVVETCQHLTPADAVAMLQIARQRYGLRGDAQAEYRAISAEFDLPESQVKLALGALRVEARTVELLAPALDFLAKDLGRLMPARLDDLTYHFRPLLGPQLTLESVNRFSTDFRGRPLFTENSGFAVPVDGASSATVTDMLTVVSSVAKAMVLRVGAAQLNIVAREASKKLAQHVAPEDVVNILTGKYPKFDWVTRPAGWFWFGPKPVSGLMSWALKLLHTADRPLHLSEVQSGLARGARKKSVPYDVDTDMPDYVLALLLEKMPEIIRAGKLQFKVRWTSRKFARSSLSITELTLVEELRKQGGVAARACLMEQLVNTEKVSLSAFDAALSGSPLFQSTGDQLWTYVGARIDVKEPSQGGP